MRVIRSLAVLLTLEAVSFGADPALLRLVMPDAKVVAGLQVGATKNSPFGQYLLSRMQVDDAGFQKFIASTGFDPRRDLSEIVMASNWASATPESRWLVIAKGTFDLEKIAHVAEESGAAVTRAQGIPVYSMPGGASPSSDNAIALFDASSAVMGDLDSVKSAIARQKSGAPASNQVLAKVRDVSAKNDFWFVTLVPLSEFAGAMPDPNLGGAMKGGTLAAINQASGGIRFGDTVNISAEAITRSEKDAQALVDVVKFIASMLQMNRQNNATAAQVSSLLDNLDCKTAGNVMTMSLAVPERQLEQMLEGLQQPARPAPKKALPQRN